MANLSTIREKMAAALQSGNLAEAEKAAALLSPWFTQAEKQEACVKGGAVEEFIEVGSLFRAAYENSPKHLKQRFQNHLFNFLDFSRSNLLLQKIYHEQKVELWFDFILSLITTSHFTVGRLFQQRASKYGSQTLFKLIKEGKVAEYSWKTVEARVESLVRALHVLCANRPASAPVAILSENSLEMACLDLACLSAGIVNVLIPVNSVASQVQYILNHCEAHTIFVSNESQLSKLLKIRSQLNTVENIILLNPSSAEVENVTTLEAFLEKGATVPSEMVQSRIERVHIDDLATIMYTSGTTDAPKGIMFTQRNLVSKRFARALALPEIGPQDTFLCYLPLFHTFGRFFEMLGCVFWGSTYVFLENPKIDTIVKTMQRMSPTIFISIPKKWIQLHEKIKENVDIDVESEAVIQQTVSQMTGGKLKWGLSAAGYLDPDIFRFFQNHGIELMSGFGMTEATGGITMTPPFQYRDNSVGKALPGIEIQLAEDGEMLIRGPYVMEGYLHSETSDFENGLLPTGDIFSQDSEGYFKILDRKKEIYKNVKGETIAPQKIENLFKDFESIKSVFLVGDHKEYNTLLLYPNYDYDQLDLAAIPEDKLREFFSSLIVSVNQFLASFERIVNLTIIDRDFSFEKGEITAKGTFKRKVVEKNFRTQIESMYKKDYLAFNLEELELRIPNWFLREKGLTADDLRLENSTLILKPHRLSLQVTGTGQGSPLVRIGTFWYSVKNHTVDLGQLIHRPAFWIGNVELQTFVGDKIFRWSRFEDSKGVESNISLADHPIKPDSKIVAEFCDCLSQQGDNFQCLHMAAYLLQTKDEAGLSKAFTFLEKIIRAKNKALSGVAKDILLRTARFDHAATKRRAFKILILSEKREFFKTIFEQFLCAGCEFLDEETISRIAELDLSKTQVRSIFEILNTYSEPGRRTREKANLLALLDLITAYGIQHPIWYKTIRSELTTWSLLESDRPVCERAKQCGLVLTAGFREWLGRNQSIAVDPETANEYRWKDVVIFEEGIDGEDKDRLFRAMQALPLIREAIFLFTDGILVRLQDILQKGIWVSFLGSLHGKSVYRVSVQTRHSGAFDLAINVNKSLANDEVDSEITWLICAGEAMEHEPLVEVFGGYWPEYDIWTEEFIPGETVERFLKRLDRYSDEVWVKRMQLLWPNLVWSGLSAYVDFWNRTGRKLEVADPAAANVIVPAHDYQVGFRIVSISNRKPFVRLADMILSFRQQFILPVEERYDKLKGRCSWHVIFASFLEVLGEEPGLQVLEQAAQELRETDLNQESAELQKKLSQFIKSVHSQGYLPKRVHFAIQRFQRWHQLNPDATPQACMQTLQEMYTTYHLENLEKTFPGSRILLFRDTIFQSSSDRLRRGLTRIMQKIKTRPVSDDQVLELVSEIRGRHPIRPDEEFFLTRMTYPHLRPTDSAEFISLPGQGAQKTALVVYIEDNDGNRFSIRQPASPKEIARLCKLFNLANLPVQFLPEHQYLLILNERQHVVGGLFYRPTDQQQVHLEKVVVDVRCRKKGVSDGLLNEFFSRLQSQGINIVTVGFLRAEFFYKFGFKIDRRYGNMVKKLEKQPRKELPEEMVEAIEI
ncbi:MAG: GNAT family N-acetyltransferase [bacterium]